MAEDKYAEMGGTAGEPGPGEETDFLEVLEQLVRDNQGLTMEPDAVPFVLNGIRNLEGREAKLRDELAKHDPNASVLKEPAGFRLIIG